MAGKLRNFTSLLGAKVASLVKKVAPAEYEHSSSFPSQAVRNKYRVDGLIGKGSFGYVWLCHEKHTNLKFACKVINKTKIKDEAARQGWEREVSVMRLLSTLGHEGLVQLQDVFETETKLELVMEYCSGLDLHDKISRSGPLTEDVARRLFAQMVTAVDFCHRHGVVHRDIKAENVILSSGDKVQAKLCDFGLARTFTEGQLMSESVGTKYWAAPELMEGRKYDQGADVWSLGVVLFCMLTGKLPPSKGVPTNDMKLWKSFVAGHVRFDLVDCSSISPDSLDLLRGMLEYKPSHRLRIEDVLHHRWFASAASCRQSFGRIRSLLRHHSQADSCDSPRSVASHALRLSPQSSCSSLADTSNSQSRHSSQIQRAYQTRSISWRT